MSYISPIQYTIYNQIVPASKVPMIEQSTDSCSFGTITIQIPVLVYVSVLNCSVYRITPPTSSISYWTRLGSDLWMDDICHYSFSQLSTQMYKIFWEFNPETIDGLGDSQYYSIEFFAEKSPSAQVPQAAPKLIVKMTNLIGSV